MEHKEPKDGYIIDFISGLEVKATPEEVEAVQVFSKILVEDYGYPVSCIQTHPQYRVKVRPSDTICKFETNGRVEFEGTDTNYSEWLLRNNIEIR